jgi:hypothetical protein
VGSQQDDQAVTRREMLKAALAAAGLALLPSRRLLAAAPGAGTPSSKAVPARKAKPMTTPPARITGVFLYWPDEMAAYEPKQWDERLAFLRGLGMDTVITQFSVIRGRAWYASRYFPCIAPNGVDPTRRLLEAAARANFKVHLGTASDERWWDVPSHPDRIPSYIELETARNNRLVGELIDYYHDVPSLAGIYLSHEIHLGQEGNQISEENLPALTEFCNRIGDFCKTHAPNLIFSNAPFFSLQGTVEKFEATWRTLLSGTRFDLMMLQDGVGCERHITVENMVPYYAAMSRACRDTNVELWTDLELFDLNPPKIVTPERVAAQLAGEAPYVSKVVAYSYANLTPDLAAKLPGL